jgi:hypothetical protein
MNSQDFEAVAEYREVVSEQQRHDQKSICPVDGTSLGCNIAKPSADVAQEDNQHTNVSNRSDLIDAASRKAKIFCLTFLAIYVVAHQIM